MPLFKYSAVNGLGKTIKGVIDADSAPEAKERLRKQQYFITSFEHIEGKQKEIVLDPSLLLSFTRELGQLLQAGLPLYESLVTIEEKYKRHRAHPLFLDFCDHLKNGSTLSSALRKYPKSFDEIYLAMVTAAESTASLPEVFKQLAELIARQQKFKRQLISSLMYPSFLGLFCLFLIAGLLFFVIPTMQELFEDRPLHPLTQAVLKVSEFANQNKMFLFVFLFTFIALFFAFSKHPKTKKMLSALSLKVPLVKTLLIHSALVRFSRATSMLLFGGVPLLEALTLSRKVMKQPLLEKEIELAEQKITEGRSLSQLLKTSSLMPPLVARMLATAEETGELAPMFQNIALIYEEEVDKHLAQITTFLQPVLLLFLGGIVGIVVLSILLPLTDVSSFLSS
jgi:general secretion pathway protein F/type IV pilus assembly protein PilC